jgi:hypothetical protein
VTFNLIDGKIEKTKLKAKENLMKISINIGAGKGNDA